SSRSYLWILSRQKRLNPTIVEELLAKAGQWGFRVEELLWVEH
ncbi:MAG: lipocalin family protein, partial [Phycisphaerae bacterium]|nr:lipocalin family protein [Phycisphaerae bacterium]